MADYDWIEGPVMRTAAGDRAWAVAVPNRHDLEKHIALQRRIPGDQTGTDVLMSAPQLAFLLKEFVRIHGPEAILKELS